MEEVQICSLSKIKKMRYSSIEEDFVNISVVDWNNDDHIKMKSRHLRGYLHLEFQDLTPEEIIKHPEFSRFKNDLFTLEQASKIIEFILDHKEQKFFVNCFAGISRSSAIAKMVCKIKGIDSDWITYPNYNPNPYVLELLEKALVMNRFNKF